MRRDIPWDDDSVGLETRARRWAPIHFPHTRSGGWARKCDRSGVCKTCLIAVQFPVVKSDSMRCTSSATRCSTSIIGRARVGGACTLSSGPSPSEAGSACTEVPRWLRDRHCERPDLGGGPALRMPNLHRGPVFTGLVFYPVKNTAGARGRRLKHRRLMRARRGRGLAAARSKDSWQDSRDQTAGMPLSDACRRLRRFQDPVGA